MYNLHEQDNNMISNRDLDTITRVKKHTQQSGADGRLGGRLTSTINTEQVGEAHSSVEWSVNSEVEVVNGKFFYQYHVKLCSVKG